MKRIIASVFLLLGTVCVSRAQVTAPAQLTDSGNAAQDFSATSAASVTLLDPLVVADSFSLPPVRSADVFAVHPMTTALLAETAPADPPAPSPKPKFIYGGRDDYRWQLSIGAAMFRFRSNAFNATAVGTQTAVVYFLNDWFGVEGDVTAAFAPTILVQEHVKLAVYGGGVKIAWRQKRWEPWIHGIFGGAHEQPQIANQTRNTYSIQAGGGADYRWNPRVSFRLEGDYVRTAFFTKGQNCFQLSGSIVFHF
jgi:hypothetical protein